MKFFILGKVINGAITLQNKDEDEDFLIEASFFTEAEIREMNVFPAILKDQFWMDFKSGNLSTKYLSLEEITF